MNIVNRQVLNFSICFLILGVAAGHLYTRHSLSSSVPPQSSSLSHSHSISQAIAIIQPTSGNSISGYVSFSRLNSGHIRVQAHVEGLAPLSKHGFHIHEFGDLRAADGTSAGGHYNPENQAHGLPPTPHRHAGSYGNLVADEHGVAKFDFEDSMITIDERHPVLGRTVVIHVNPDDGSQPLGNAGPRMGVGVIGIANPSANLTTTR